MKTHRTITLIVGPLVALLVAAPTTAIADSLLSGYGGPGQGSQAILGAVLLKGPGSHGGSSGGGSSADGSSGGGSSGGSSSSVGPSTTAANLTASSRHRSGGAGAPPTRGVSRSSGGTPKIAASPVGAYPASARGSAAPAADPLGLTGQDLGYGLLALAALLSTAVLTRWLTRASQRAGAGGSPDARQNPSR
jgi:hypothetical protein